MFEVPCSYRLTAEGPDFIVWDTGEAEGTLRVEFQPVAWYPAEPDTGQGADFDARIVGIDFWDVSGEWTGRNRNRLRALEGPRYKKAFAFLEAHHRNAMWEAAEELAARTFRGAA